MFISYCVWCFKKEGDATVIRIIPYSGRLWHPALPGCQDVTGPIPSVFLNSGVKLISLNEYFSNFLKKEISFLLLTRGRICMLATTKKNAKIILVQASSSSKLN